MDKLSGTVAAGMGKGKAFLSHLEYQKRIEKRIGFVPFAGTLNLKIDSKEWKQAKKQLSKKTLFSFKHQQQSFGGLDFYACRLPDQSNAAVIVPHKTTHAAGIIEIIAVKNLREKFELKNGEAFEILLGNWNEKKG